MTAATLRKHQACIAAAKARGARIAAFKCPDCAKAIETLRPPRGDTWDSMSTCPHCDALFHKSLRHKGPVTITRLDKGGAALS